jgi:N-glycosylase/DNA lyase
LNIFLRDALYTTYLCDRFALERAEGLLEIPLDSITAKQLQDELGRNLPRWPGVRRLTKAISDVYQEGARRVAAHRGIAPLHLDTYWWGGDRQDAV